MKLTVENFGPIKKAEVALAPMTVFVGPSNTGKSYLAILVYSIMSAVRERGPGRFVQKGYFSVWNERSDSADEKDRDLRKFLLRRIDESFMVWAKNLADVWKEKLADCFPLADMQLLMKKEMLLKVSNDEGQLVLNLSSPEKSKISAAQKQDVHAVIQQFAEVAQLDAELAVDSNVSAVEAALRLQDRYAIHTFEDHLCPILAAMLQGWDEMSAHYLPGTRSFLMQNLRAQLALPLGREAEEPIERPLFIADFLQKLLYWDSPHNYRAMLHGDVGMGTKQQKAKIEKISARMEKKIMEGELKAEAKFESLPNFQYVFGHGDSAVGPLPLSHASSMVAELAAMVAFIRKYTRPGDLLIIEEPETGLHPGAQRDVANVLVQLANASVHLLITTHSDIILEQLGNAIAASKIDAKIAAEKLEEENASVYFFHRPKKWRQGTTVKKVSFDRETGILTKDHLDVSSALYNESVDLFNAGEKTRKKGRKNAG